LLDSGSLGREEVFCLPEHSGTGSDGVVKRWYWFWGALIGGQARNDLL
jgi:hypothetical protein